MAWRRHLPRPDCINSARFARSRSRPPAYSERSLGGVSVRSPSLGLGLGDSGGDIRALPYPMSSARRRETRASSRWSPLSGEAGTSSTVIEGDSSTNVKSTPVPIVFGDGSRPYKLSSAIIAILGQFGTCLDFAFMTSPTRMRLGRGPHWRTVRGFWCPGCSRR